MRREIAEGCQVPGRTDQGFKTPRWSVRKAHFVTTKARRSALHLPSKRGEKLKAHLARRRGDEKPWLFESTNQEFEVRHLLTSPRSARGEVDAHRQMRGG